MRENKAEKKVPLIIGWERVTNKCAEFAEARILSTDDGFYVLRLDAKGVQQGVYLFDQFGNLKASEAPQQVDLYNEMMAYLTRRNPKDTGMVILKKGERVDVK
jgi:hypothetical protein